TSDEDDPLITRSREVTDNVIPASNSTLALDLFYLGTYLYQEAYLQRAEQMLNNVIVNVREDGPYFAQWASLLAHAVWAPFEVAIVGDEWDARRREFAAGYHPDVFFLGGAEEGKLELLERKLVPDITRIYVCQDKYCKLPVETVEAAKAQLTR
ncbi:MAG: thioredoxin domain-containing protein, partial [Bacteroidetes bacterium]